MKSQLSSTKAEQHFFASIKNWYRDTYVKKDGTSPLYIYVYVKREKVVFNTGVAVKKNFWDYESESIRRNHPKASDLNLIHNNCRSRINDIFVRYKLQNEELTPQLLRKEYATPTSYIDFYAFAEHVLRSRRNELSPGTYKHHNSFLKKLREYKKKLMFSEIDREFITSYMKHLKKVYMNSPATIVQNMNKFKVYLNLARRQGIMRKNPFDEIKLPRVKSDRVFLTDDELRTLIDKYTKNELPEAYNYTLMIFLFACFTSLRISDVREFKMTFSEWRSVIKAKQNGFKILKGQTYLRQFNRDSGNNAWTFRAIPEINKICLKFDLYSE